MSYALGRATLLGAGLLLSAARGGTPDPTQGAGRVIVKVGDRTLNADQLGKRLAEIPRVQLAALKGEGSPRERYVDQVAVPELLLDAEAERLELARTPAARAGAEQLLVETLTESLRDSISRDVVTDELVAGYFSAHRADFGHPEKLRLFRLLVKERSEAETLLEKAKHLTDMAMWRDLTREHSIDKATRMRGGDLGFVHPDGNTDVPRVRVPRELFEAAARVEDGALVPEPVPEGDLYAVVWRRGSVSAVEPKLEEAAPRIRRLLVEAKLEETLDALVASLSKGKVTRDNLQLLEELSVTTPADPRVVATARLGPDKPRPARPEVRDTDTGSR